MLDEPQRLRFGQLADVLIPAAGGMPSAGEVGVADRWLSRVLEVRADLEPELCDAIGSTGVGDAGEAIAQLRADDPSRLATLGFFASAAYYLSPKVRRLIGYRGQRQVPILPDEGDYYLRDDLLAPVIERSNREDWPASGETTRASQPARAPSLAPVLTPVTAGLHANDRHHTGRPPSLQHEVADVVIIGAGVAGSVAAKHFAAHGFSVVCLEQGDWTNPSSFPGSRRDWELFTGKEWNTNPNVRALPVDYPCQSEDSDIAPVMFNGVGGSSIHFGAQWARMRPRDFKVRTYEGIGDDWPVSYDEMLPYYEIVDVEMGISGLGGDPKYPPGAPPPLPALPLGKIGRTGALGMNKLGWHWWPGTNAIPSEPPGDGRRACARWGVCLYGCPEGAKGSTDLTYWPQALRHGARLLTRARVREIRVAPNGLVDGVVYIDRRGVERFQAASVVIVAANGVGTPRLLRLSVSSRFPEGLANSSGLVGRRLMLHPYVTVVGIYEQDLDSWVGPTGNPVISLEFADTDESRGFAMGAQWDLFGTKGPLLVLDLFADALGADRWGSRIHELVGETLGHSFQWGIGLEDLPRERNCVTLDDELVDGDGIPAPRVSYRIDENAKRNRAFQITRAIEAHEAAGAKQTIVVDRSESGWHLLGTCRMGDDPETSVVDRFGRAHDVENLFVLDGSVFVTSGPEPPTATICANALRCAAHVMNTASLQRVAV